MPASADAWFYTNILGIPTLETGCGHLRDAHTKSEHVVLKEIAEEAAVLTLFIKEWCGFWIKSVIFCKIGKKKKVSRYYHL